MIHSILTLMLDFLLLVVWFNSWKSFCCFHWGLDLDLSRELLLSVWFIWFLLHEYGERDKVLPGQCNVCSILRHACKVQSVNHTLKAEIILKKNSTLDFLSYWRWFSHRKNIIRDGKARHSLELTWNRNILTYDHVWTETEFQMTSLCSGFQLMGNCNIQGNEPTALFFQCSHFACNFTLTDEGMEPCLFNIKYYSQNFRLKKVYLTTIHIKYNICL